MDFLVSETGRAVAAFWERRFEEVLSILYQAWSQWDMHAYGREDMSDFIYNALCDAIEMTELIAENSPMLELEAYQQNLFQRLQAALHTFTNEAESADWQTISQLFPDFLQLLWGWSQTSDFLTEKGFNLTDSPPQVSFKLTTEGYLCLYVWEGVPNALSQAQKMQLQRDFNALFEAPPVADSPDSYWLGIEKQIKEQDWKQALAGLEQFAQHFPKQQRSIFKRMGDIYMNVKEFNKAVDSYMKSMVLGEPKESFSQAIQQVAQNLLAQCQNEEEKERMQDWLQPFL